MSNNTNNTLSGREWLIVIAGITGLVAIVLAAVSFGLYKFFEWASPENSRLVWLVILSWLVVGGFLLGLWIGREHSRGFRDGHEHSARVVTAATVSRPAEQPPTIIDYSHQWSDEPRAYGQDESEPILRQLEMRP